MGKFPTLSTEPDEKNRAERPPPPPRRKTPTSRKIKNKKEFLEDKTARPSSLFRSKIDDNSEDSSSLYGGSSMAESGRGGIMNFDEMKALQKI